MKALNLHRLCVLGVMGVLPLAFTFSVAAGEKIIVTEGKSQTDPTKDVKTGSDLFKSSTKFEEPNLYEGTPVLPRFGPSLSKKEQDRLKMRREAKENWLVNPPENAQRREEEESTLGVRNNPFADLNKGSTKWLEPKGNPNQRLPGQLQSASQKQEQAEARQAAQDQRNREDEEDSKGRTKTFDLTSPTEGAHTASELNLKSLFDPSQKESLSSASGGKADFSLGALLGTTPQRSKEYQARMDDFNKLVNLPAAQAGQNLFGPGNPQSGAPAVAVKPPEAPSTRPTGGDFFRQNPGSFGSGPSRFDPPGMPSLNNNNNSAFGNASPFQRQMPAAQDSSRTWSMKPIEPQRRKF